MNKVYQVTEEECRKRIHGVCEGCGRKLEPIETVDNSGQPTFWVGCKHCNCFRCGIEEKYFKVARELVEKDKLLPYSSMSRYDYEKTPEKLDYFFDSQTAGLSHTIKEIHQLLLKTEVNP